MRRERVKLPQLARATRFGNRYRLEVQADSPHLRGDFAGPFSCTLLLGVSLSHARSRFSARTGA